MVTGGGFFLSAYIRSHLDTTHLAACVNPEGKSVCLLVKKKKGAIFFQGSDRLSLRYPLNDESKVSPHPRVR